MRFLLSAAVLSALMLAGCVVEGPARGHHEDHYYPGKVRIYVIDHHHTCPPGRDWKGYCYLDREDYERARNGHGDHDQHHDDHHDNKGHDSNDHHKGDKGHDKNGKGKDKNKDKNKDKDSDDANRKDKHRHDKNKQDSGDDDQDD